MTDPRPLDTVARFSDRAADYVRYRPGYPADAIHTIVDGLGPPGDLVAADVGAGTGISARLFGDRGLRVVAVEPGAGLRAAAALHARYADTGGFVTLVYETDVYCSSKR